MKNKIWYLGLDIGSASVGWAATDEEYKVIRKNKKRLWGVRLFEEATTAEERRGYRSNRRRLARRKWRLDLLEELFASEINKVDPNFYLKLKESKYHSEDKSVKVPYAIFNDKDYTDKDFYEEYPTIYHLRAKLMAEPVDDIRKLFLAVHHILKNRGHFLYEDLSLERHDIKKLLIELFIKVLDIDESEVEIDLIKEIEKISLEDKLSSKDKKNQVKKLLSKKLLFGNNMIKFFNLIFGDKIKLEDLFKDIDCSTLEPKEKSLSFKSLTYDENRGKYTTIIRNDIEILDLCKKIYNSITLNNILPEGKLLSESKVELYEKHKEDLIKLKSLVKNDSKLDDNKKSEVYFVIFKEDKNKGTNYVNYIRKSEEGKGCNYEDFKKFLVKELAKLEESEIKSEILQQLELESFLPLQKTKDNSVVPYQIHKEELVKILDNAAKRFNFLNEKDDSGYSVTEKIIQLLEFRIPYYVGPLNSNKKANEGGFAWSVRNSGYEKTPVTPWNYEKVIDESASAEKFITNLTNKCTYLKGEDVLPKNSLLYSEYELLNELTGLKYDGVRISVEARDFIIKELFIKQDKKVKLQDIKECLKVNGFIDGNGEMTGIEDSVKSDLRAYKDFKYILGEKFNAEHIERIIMWKTLYVKENKFVVEKIRSTYNNFYTENEISEICKLNYSGWGRLSKKLLTEIISKKMYSEETGESLNIIGAMRKNNILFIELMSDKFDYYKQVIQHNKQLREKVTEITPEILDDLYVSPSVKRSIWQTVRIVEELKEIIGSAPAKIFVETTRKNIINKKKTKSRREQLIELYKGIKDKEIVEIQKTLDYNFDYKEKKNELAETEKDLNFNKKVLYLYYTQLGRCMYTGKRIILDQIYNTELYNIDHINPRSKVKDDSIHDNLVLVTKDSNEKKGDLCIANTVYQTKENKAFWKFLEKKGLITKEKYNRLTRVADFSDDELSGFIARQLVETSQSVKAAAEILGELNPDTAICYSKAENVSSFRQNFGKIKEGNRKSKNSEQLVKVREINDLHHAKDAYLNIVVGNVFDTKFTRNVFNFIKNKKDARKYSLNNVFYESVANADTVAWEVGKTIHQVEKVMNNNNILVTRRTAEKKGKFYNESHKKAKYIKNKIEEKEENRKKYYPIKSTDKSLSNITEYGGYSSGFISYFTIVEYKINNKKIVYIVPIPIAKAHTIKNNKELLRYINNEMSDNGKYELTGLTVLYNKFKEKTLIKINDYYYWSGGRSNETFYANNAFQLVFSTEVERYLSKILKFKYKKEKDKELSVPKEITVKKNIWLYDELLEKMSTKILRRKHGNKYEQLSSKDVKDKFEKLGLEEQMDILLEVLDMMVEKINSYKNCDIYLGVKKSKYQQNLKLDPKMQFSVIEQSITGFYEKEITIIGEKNNDVENNNS